MSLSFAGTLVADSAAYLFERVLPVVRAANAVCSAQERRSRLRDQGPTIACNAAPTHMQ